MHIKKSQHRQKGFTLLFAVLISMLVISIGATIMSISTRQIILSGTSRESQYAFYAANTALECAYYWDTKKFEDGSKVFSSDSDNPQTYDDLEITCAGGNIRTGDGFTVNAFSQPWTAIDGITTFRMVITNTRADIASNIEIDQLPRTCAVVTVTKDLDTRDEEGGIQNSITRTKIESRGYNTCDLSNPRAVERGVELEYES